MNRTQVRNLLAIARTGSLSRASDVLHISQPALTRSLKQMETDYGVPLFERLPRGVSPTIFGDVLLQHAEAMEFELRRARQEIDALRVQQSAHVRVAAAPIALQSLVPKATTQFLQEIPGATVSVKECAYLNPYDEPGVLLSGESDFLIGILLDDQESGRLVQDFLFDVEVIVIARCDHPLAGQSEVTLEDMLAFRWILPPNGTVPRSLLEAALRADRLQHFIPPVETIHRQVIFQLLRESDMLSFIPHHPFCVPVDWKNYMMIRLSLAMHPRPIGIIRRASTPLLAPAARFVEIVRALVAASDPSLPDEPL